MRSRRSIKLSLPQTVLEWIVIVVIAAILIALLLPSRPFDADGAARGRCRNNLNQIALALDLYHDAHGCFPPAYVADANGRPIHSWRALILPYLDVGNPFMQYRFDEPWNGPHNSRLADQVPEVYQCPSDVYQRTTPEPWTSYVAVTGAHTCWPEGQPLKQADITDPTDRTLLVVETAASGIPWLEPRDLVFVQMPRAINPPTGQGISSVHKGGANVVRADGSAWFLGAEQTQPEDLRRYLERDDGEPTPEM